MSYLFGPSSSTSSDDERAKLAKAKFALTHLARSPVKGRKAAKKLISKAFNPVAGRPTRTIANSQRQVACALSYVTSAWKTTSVTVPVFASEVFTVTSFAASAAYLALFDQYRIDEIEVWIEPIISQSSAVALTSNYTTAIDTDDSNVPASVSDVDDHQSAIITGGESGHYHRWKPHMATAVYSGAFTSFANEEADWIDSASPNVQHYGLKFCTHSATSTAMIYSLTVRAKISFRSPGL